MDYDIDITRLFSDADAPLELIDRIDQTWNRLLADVRQTPRDYLRATHAVVGATVRGMARGLGAEGRQLRVTYHNVGRDAEPGDVELLIDPTPNDDTVSKFVDELVMWVAPSPGISPMRPGYAVAVATARAVAGMAGLDVRILEDGMQTRYRPTFGATPDLLARIVEYELPGTASSIATIRRVLKPRTNDQLASWLGRNRTTVREWESPWNAVEGDHRLRTVARLADVLDAQVEPEDVEGYVHDVKVDALHGLTFSEAMSQFETIELDAAVDELASALIW